MRVVVSEARRGGVCCLLRRAVGKATLLMAGALVLATPVKAQVEVFVSNNSYGTINRYTDGVLTGQLPAQGSTYNDFARGVELGPDGLIYTDRLGGSAIQAYNPTTLAPTGPAYTLNSDGGKAYGAYSVSFGPDGSMYVAVMSNDSIQKFSPGSTTGTLLVSSQSGGLKVPMDTLVVGNVLYVSSFPGINGTQGSVLRYNATTGAFIDTFIAPGENGLTGPVGLALAPDGNILVSGFEGNDILKFNPTTKGFVGTFVTPGEGGLTNPDDITYDDDNGELYVSSTYDNTVRKYNGMTGAYDGMEVMSGAGGLQGGIYLAVLGSDKAASVPLPAGSWGGVALLGCMAAMAWRRKITASKFALVPVAVRAGE